MRLRPFSARVGSPIENGCSNDLTPVSDGAKIRDRLRTHTRRAFESHFTYTRNYPPDEWQDCGLCYDYRHSEMYGLPELNVFTGATCADFHERVRRGISSTNDLH